MFGNFAKLDSPRRLVQFWQNFQTSLVLLIPNCTRQRMITYTNMGVKARYYKCKTVDLRTSNQAKWHKTVNPLIGVNNNTNPSIHVPETKMKETAEKFQSVFNGQI